MKRANISTTKNNLSKLIEEVRGGEAIIIVDRDVPVARLEPVGNLDQYGGRVPRLAREGAVALPRAQLDVARFLARQKALIAGRASAVDALVSERSEGR